MWRPVFLRPQSFALSLPGRPEYHWSRCPREVRSIRSCVPQRVSFRTNNRGQCRTPLQANSSRTSGASPSGRGFAQAPTAIVSSLIQETGTEEPNEGNPDFSVSTWSATRATAGSGASGRTDGSTLDHRPSISPVSCCLVNSQLVPLRRSFAQRTRSRAARMNQVS